MNSSIRKFPALALFAGALLAVASGSVLSAPKFRTGDKAEITFDGLHRVDDTIMDAAWVKPDIDLSGYTKIMVLPAGMTFKDERGLRHSSTQFPLTEKQKQTLRETIFTVFVEELGKSKRFELTNDPGPDVLQIRGAVLDVVSNVPPDPVGRGGYILRSLGEATLVFELHDSMSEEILARAVDRRTVSPTFIRKSSQATNLADVRSAARTWAGQLRKRLDEFTEI